MIENSVELTELPAHGMKGKNSSDIKLVVDALESALLNPHLDTFVIVSSDSDYTPLLSKLRERDKYVIIVGVKEDMSPFLAGHCDEVLYLDGNAVGAGDRPVAKPTNAALTLFRRAIANLADKGIVARGAQVKSEMRGIDPRFDEKEMGYVRFRAFVEAAVAVISGLHIEQEESGGDYVVSRRPNGAVTASIQPAPVALGYASCALAEPVNLEEHVAQVLSDGPKPLNDVVMAIKSSCFADNVSVSAMGLRRHVQRLVRGGFLRELQIDAGNLLTLR